MWSTFYLVSLSLSVPRAKNLKDDGVLVFVRPDKVESRGFEKVRESDSLPFRSLLLELGLPSFRGFVRRPSSYIMGSDPAAFADAAGESAQRYAARMVYLTEDDDGALFGGTTPEPMGRTLKPPVLFMSRRQARADSALCAVSGMGADASSVRVIISSMRLVELARVLLHTRAV